MKKLINGVLAKLGYRLSAVGTPVTPANPLDSFLARLERRGFRPGYLIDVGTNHGGWTRAFLKRFPDAAVTMIEPQEGLKTYVADLLTRPNVNWITAGAGRANTTMKFTFAQTDDSCNFRVTPEDAARAGLRQIDVPIYSLDHVVSINGNRIPDVVKIDAEGLDLEVVDGASTLIGKTEIFMVEASLGARDIPNTLPLVVARMGELGYAPLDFTDLNYSPAQGVLWLVEIAFARKDGPIINGIKSNYF